jgi:hypothetical protein
MIVSGTGSTNAFAVAIRYTVTNARRRIYTIRLRH